MKPPRKGNTMTPTPTTPVQPEPTVKKFKVLDENLTFVEKEAKLIFTPETDLSSAMERLGNDQTKILAALNDAIESDAWKAEKQKVLAGTISKKAAFAMIAVFRTLPPYSDMVPEKGTVPTKERSAKRAEQTKALLEVLKSTPFMMNALKAQSEKMLASGAEEDEDDEDEEKN